MRVKPMKSYPQGVMSRGGARPGTSMLNNSDYIRDELVIVGAKSGNVDVLGKKAMRAKTQEDLSLGCSNALAGTFLGDLSNAPKTWHIAYIYRIIFLLCELFCQRTPNGLEI